MPAYLVTSSYHIVFDIVMLKLLWYWFNKSHLKTNQVNVIPETHPYYYLEITPSSMYIKMTGDIPNLVSENNHLENITTT